MIHCWILRVACSRCGTRIRHLETLAVLSRTMPRITSFHLCIDGRVDSVTLSSRSIQRPCLKPAQLPLCAMRSRS